MQLNSAFDENYITEEELKAGAAPCEKTPQANPIPNS
jgi:hypothetical protein